MASHWINPPNRGKNIAIAVKGKFMLSLKSKIIAGLAMVAIYGLLAIGLALSLPSSNVIFQKYDDRVDARFTDGSRQTVVAFDYGNSQLPAAPTLFLEEPDVLPTYAEMETFSIHMKLYIQHYRKGSYR